MAKQVWMKEDSEAQQSAADYWDEGGRYEAKKKRKKEVEEGQYADLGF